MRAYVKVLHNCFNKTVLICFLFFTFYVKLSVPPHTMFYNLRIFRPKQDDSAFNKTAKSAPLNNTKDTNGKYVRSFHERRVE